MILLLGFALLLAACGLAPFQLPSARPAAPPAPSSDAAWRPIADGLQWRKLLPAGDELAQLIVVRIDPSHYRFRALYRAGQPESLSGWQTLAPETSVIINANFFDTDYEALGLVVSDGEPSGVAYRDRGGSFLIRGDQPEIVTYRSARAPKIDSIEQAVQGFPLLVEAGRQAYFGRGSGQRTRRTMIGIDRQGMVLIMVAPYLGLSLADLSAYLPSTDLDIDTAFNLDGGASTMIALPGAGYRQPSLDPAPAILAVYRRAGG